MTVTVHHGDSREVLKGFADASIDSCVCDPPYALVSIGKRFGAENAAPAKVGKSGAYARASAGFMGQKWDTGETAFDPLFWVEVLRVLKPGGHLIAFSGTRTYHRLACAIEDAGFEMRDMIAWNYGSGFPKSHNVVKRLQDSGLACRCPKTIVSSHYVCDENLHDLQRGLDASQPLSGGSQSDVRAALYGGGDQSAGKGTTGEGFTLHSLRELRDDGAPPALSCGSVGGDVLQPVLPVQELRGSASPDGGEHEGQAGDAADGREEPSLEGRGDAQAPARKLQGRSLRQSAGVGATDGTEGRLHHGASACDGANVRLPADADGSGQPRGPQPGEQSPVEPDALPDERGSQAWGGWPVCPGCLQPVVPEGYGTALKPALEPVALARKALGKGLTVAANVLQHGTGALNIDASRIAAGAGDYSHPGNSGIEDKRDVYGKFAHGNQSPPSDKGRWPANVIHDGSEEVVGAFPETASGAVKAGTRDNGKDPGTYGAFGGRVMPEREVDSGSAARFFYSAKADAADRCGSKHPTVKPVDLMAYLVRMVTPPGGVTLDPFAGSGSTGMACLREGFDCILIEREAQYVADIHRRLAHVEGADTPLFANDQEAGLFDGRAA